MDNYHCHSVYNLEKKEIQVINIVDFSPNFTMLCMILEDTKPVQHIT